MEEKLIFYIAQNRLIQLKHNGETRASWYAVSGPKGEGVLPKGKYSVLRYKVSAFTSEIKSGFKITSGLGEGKGFFLPLKPNFVTHRGKPGKGRFGIHPDGLDKGTHGCIGIQANASLFYSLLSKNTVKLTLTVQ